MSTHRCLGSSSRLQCRLGSHSSLAALGGAVAPAAAATIATAAMDLSPGVECFCEVSEPSPVSGAGSVTFCWHLSPIIRGRCLLYSPPTNVQPAQPLAPAMQTIILDVRKHYIMPGI